MGNLDSVLHSRRPHESARPTVGSPRTRLHHSQTSTELSTEYASRETRRGAVRAADDAGDGVGGRRARFAEAEEARERIRRAAAPEPRQPARGALACARSDFERAVSQKTVKATPFFLFSTQEETPSVLACGRAARSSSRRRRWRRGRGPPPPHACDSPKPTPPPRRPRPSVCSFLDFWCYWPSLRTIWTSRSSHDVRSEIRDRVFQISLGNLTLRILCKTLVVWRCASSGGARDGLVRAVRGGRVS